MTVFVGEYDRSVDSAGRVALPRDVRDLLADRCFATQSPEGCLVIRTPEDYVTEAERIAALEKAGELPTGFGRRFASRTMALPIDKQGRINLDEPLREFAAIEAGGNVKLIGNIDELQIWRPSRWSVIDGEDGSAVRDRVWNDQ